VVLGQTSPAVLPQASVVPDVVAQQNNSAATIHQQLLIQQQLRRGASPVRRGVSPLRRTCSPIRHSVAGSVAIQCQPSAVPSGNSNSSTAVPSGSSSIGGVLGQPQDLSRAASMNSAEATPVSSSQAPASRGCALASFGPPPVQVLASFLPTASTASTTTTGSSRCSSWSGDPDRWQEDFMAAWSLNAVEFDEDLELSGPGGVTSSSCSTVGGATESSASCGPTPVVTTQGASASSMACREPEAVLSSASHEGPSPVATQVACPEAACQPAVGGGLQAEDSWAMGAELDVSQPIPTAQALATASNILPPEALSSLYGEQHADISKDLGDLSSIAMAQAASPTTQSPTASPLRLDEAASPTAFAVPSSQGGDALSSPSACSLKGGELDLSTPCVLQQTCPGLVQASASRPLDDTMPCPDLSADASPQASLDVTDSFAPRRRMARPTQVVANDLRGFGR